MTSKTVDLATSATVGAARYTTRKDVGGSVKECGPALQRGDGMYLLSVVTGVTVHRTRPALLQERVCLGYMCVSPRSAAKMLPPVHLLTRGRSQTMGMFVLLQHRIGRIRCVSTDCSPLNGSGESQCQ